MEQKLKTTHQDIEKKTEEERLLLATACQKTEEAIMITDKSGKIQYVNPALERLTGYSCDELLDQNPHFLKSGKHDRFFYEDFWTTILSGEVWNGRFVNKRKNGSLYEEKATISPVEDENGEITHFVAIKRDVTEEVNLHKRLLHAQKSEALGALAGGVIHDLNNLLQVILGYSDLFLVETSKGSRLNQALAEIASAARSGAALAEGLLTFNRKAEAKSRPVSFNDSVEHIHKLLSRTIFKMGEVEIYLSPDLALIHADPTQLEHVLMNLAINAKDAMTEDGKLIITTKNISVTEADSALQHHISPGDYVFVSVSDSGHGIEKEVLPHIFKPFFSTKETEKGNGLGMFVVREIVEQHSGHIICTSEPGVGTTFKMYFPVVSSPVDFENVECESIPSGGTETILLIDDELPVREVGKSILQQFGYKVLTAGSCAEALDIYSCMREEIALVILDLIMPDMPGSRCLQELHRMNPATKVLVTSGYSWKDIQQEAEIDAKWFVQKPLEARTLLQAVRDALAAED